jgi:hypothetical protein
MQGKATTKENPVDFYWIESHADFTPCMLAVGSIGFSGILTSTVGADGQLIWQLVLNGIEQADVAIKIGEVLGWDGMKLSVFPDSDSFQALHNIVSTQ